MEFSDLLSRVNEANVNITLAELLAEGGLKALGEVLGLAAHDPTSCLSSTEQRSSLKVRSSVAGASLKSSVIKGLTTVNATYASWWSTLSLKRRACTRIRRT
jgi:hypothetical protein